MANWRNNTPNTNPFLNDDGNARQPFLPAENPFLYELDDNPNNIQQIPPLIPPDRNHLFRNFGGHRNANQLPQNLGIQRNNGRNSPQIGNTDRLPRNFGVQRNDDAVPQRNNRRNSAQRNYENQENGTHNNRDPRNRNRRRNSAEVNRQLNTNFTTNQNNGAVRRNVPHDKSKGSKTFHLGFKKLEELSCKSPEDCLLQILRDQIQFAVLLGEDLSGDYIVLVIKVLSKICESTYNESKISLFMISIDDKFMKNLLNFIFSLTIQNLNDKKKNKYFWNNSNEFFMNVLIVCKHLLNLLPTLSSDKIEKLVKVISKTLPELEGGGCSFNDDIKTTLQDVEYKLKIVLEDVEKRNKKINKRTETDLEDEADLEPPDDFRQMAIYPKVEELLLPEKPFIRKNVIKGPYRNPNHYLDIQFRLLREDFIGPLRNAIHSYLNPNKKKIENVKVHKKVQFITKYNKDNTLGTLLKFNFGKKIKFNENSKRLIYGSLLCFTNTNFQTMFFGKVVERKPEHLREGMIVVDLYDVDEINYGIDYVMLECSIFFEPYYQVLTALVNMDEDRFPLEKYILYVDPEAEPPAYINNTTNMTVDKHSFPLLNFQFWPNAIDLGLNDAQYSAFKNAMTKQLVVIQGPPGTGKTFLGLKIAKSLIKNKYLWHEYSPILVVCYTNHALDQFLEGLSVVTENIIRIGGQSKNEKMNKFNIRQKRSGLRSIDNSQARAIYYRDGLVLREILQKIKQCVEHLNATNEYKGIVNIDNLEHLDPEIKGTKLENLYGMSLKEWLFGHSGPNVDHTDANSDLPISEFDEDILSTDGDNVLDLDDDLMHNIGLTKTPYQITLNNIQHGIKSETDTLLQIKTGELQNDLRLQIEYYQREQKIQELRDMEIYLRENLEYGQQAKIERKPRNWRRLAAGNIPLNIRWCFYFYWLHLYREKLKKLLIEYENQHKTCLKKYVEARDMIDLSVMRSSLVVGMTTTGAARMQATLRALHCPIVIVEEAAEVLESHVVVCLTNSCTQLILIGDHQQLRPSTSNYDLERYYQLGISMFERMVQNDIHCDVLNIQHRMRPEISALICPAIYSTLENAPSVYRYPPVNGVQKSLFFINHSHPEDEESTDTTSKKNIFEAEYLINLARYLLLNGYQPEEITIVAAYAAQMFLLRNLRQQYAILKNVKITVLDNYQGEENKIILLSLVRSNQNNSVGFLKIENRVCVALSRAKEGMYVIGNMTLLCNSSEIWVKIKAVLDQQNSIGSILQLYCNEHDVTTYIESLTDFAKVPEGGCSNPCAKVLICGHACTKVCHASDKDHIEYKCTEICNKPLCELQHLCKKPCAEQCGPCKYLVQKTLPCKHTLSIECYLNPDEYSCPVMVERMLPCSHNDSMPCHRNPETHKCPIKCDSRIEPCGHSCTLTCHKFKDPDHLEYCCNKPCAKPRKDCSTNEHICERRCYQECQPCEVQVSKQRTICPHKYKVACNVDVDSISCLKPCMKILPCTHKCKNPCFDDCGPCLEMVSKQLNICGHIVKAKCCDEPDRKKCYGKCPLLLVCGHKCTRKCNEPCTRLCKVLVDNIILPACGHNFKIPCCTRKLAIKNNSYEILKHCPIPCHEKLKCGHTCKGTCGECVQGRVHKECQEKCQAILSCGHECTAPCNEACRPCQKQCSYQCIHSKCKKKCGEPCTSCKERCPRSCPHVKCTKLCGQICDVPPCTEPCKKTLKCGHNCIGFCGETCPPLCRICNLDELMEYYTGYEDEDDAMFVYLKECGHTLESRGMNHWLESKNDGSDQEIGAAYCPRCKTVLCSTPRYGNYIKETCKNLTLIKQKHFGDVKKITALRAELLNTIDKMCIEYASLLNQKNTSVLMDLLLYIKTSASTVKNGRRQTIDKMRIDTLNAKFKLLEDLIKICQQYKLKGLNNALWLSEFLKYFCHLLTRNGNVMMQQESADINNEISKFNRIIQFLNVKENINETLQNRADIKKIIDNFDTLINSVSKYTDEDDEKYKNELIELNEISKSGLNISDRERKEILSAMGLSRGHYYKCPNGHVYVITECGGAMQVGKCNECGAKIGGSHHQLLASNAVATEMDGARYSAFSNQANLENYDIRDLL